jgi:hypothetical protein
MNPDYGIYEVENRAAFAAAVIAASRYTLEEARLNPFVVHLVGTNFKLTAPKGMHVRAAGRVAKLVRQTPAHVFRAVV